MKCALIAALLTAAAFAQSDKQYLSSPRRALTAPELNDAPDEWIDRSLRWAGDILDDFPPTPLERPVRRAALIRLDDVLHIPSAPSKPLVQKFYRARMEKAVAEIETSPVEHGMRIWKLYNHGFFVRTRDASFAFDIVPGIHTPGFTVDDALLGRLADQADALFITHRHNDHASPEVARLFMDRRKQVIAPEGLWKGHEIAHALTYPERSTTEVHTVPIRRGVLKVVVYPGHQGPEILNNVYAVTTPDGFTVVHTGDQTGDDFDWIDRIGRRHKVDVLMPNCWTDDIQRVARGVNPRLIITGHENEMGHSVDHREDYTQTYNHLFGTRYPFLVMAWGESYLYRR